MNAELLIKEKTCDYDIFDMLFGGRGDKWYVVKLINSRGETLSSITQANMDTIYEIFDIAHDTKTFHVDPNRLNYLLYKYRNHHRFIDLKKILRPIICYGITDVSLSHK